MWANMAIPDFQSCMLPLLKVLSDNEERTMKDLTAKLADHFELTEDEREEMLPSGQTSIIVNRVGWAKTYLKNAKLLEQPKRGVVKLTKQGQQAIKDANDRIDMKFLERYPAYIAFRDKTTPRSDQKKTEIETRTPDEAIDAEYKKLTKTLASDLLEQVRNNTPEFFERLVVKLLVAMGYGGSLEDAGQAIGKSGDEGIDGIIKEDKLGLDVVVIQAKRYAEDNVVGRPAIQSFAGSMEPHKAKKGVFITTSSFAKTAHDYVKQIERKIVLIDGDELANLMIEHDIGVTTYNSFALKRVDLDYFEE
jgi:restriction system protein